MLALSLAMGVAAAFAWGLAPPVEASDVGQGRANVTVGGQRLEQTFTPAHDGLSAFEITGGAAGQKLHLVVRRSGAAEPLASADATVAQAGANVRFEFPPLPDTSGQVLVAVITADNAGLASASVWNHDGYLQGALVVDGIPQPGDLRFSTSYTLSGRAALGFLAHVLAAARTPLAVVVLWAILFSPGLCFISLSRFPWQAAPGTAASPGVSDTEEEWWVRWAKALGISLAFWPLAWLLAPWRWTTTTLAVMLVPLGVIALACEGRRAARALREWRTGTCGTAVWLAAILAFTAAARALAVRDLALPPWVDSSRHALITQLFVLDGHVPVTYAPLVDVPRFFYHFGFHALAATFSLLAGQTVDAALLVLGQALNALVPLTTYALAVWITGSRRAGLAAAFAVGVLAVYPAYFVSWGRYTQLTGLLLLPIAMISAGELVGWPRDAESGDASRDPAGRGTLGWRLAPPLLAAGLFLVHYRVFAFWLAWLVVAGAAGLARTWRTHQWPGIRRVLGACAASVVVAAALLIPWWLQIARDALPQMSLAALLTSPRGYNAFPNDYFDRGVERAWLASGFVAALAVLIAGRRRALGRHWRAFAVAGWAGLVTVALNLDRLGGPATWLVNNQSWAISLFVPAAVMAGWGVDRAAGFVLWTAERISRWAPRELSAGRVACSCALAFAAGCLGVFGTWQGVAVVNPATILTTADDRAALAWVAQHTPPGSVFLVSARYWLASTWIVPDGGAWLTPLALRRTTLPPVDYGFDRPLRDRVNAFNARLSASADVGSPALRAELDALGVRYAYVGAYESLISADALLRDPGWAVVYTNGGVWIFVRAPD